VVVVIVAIVVAFVFTRKSNQSASTPTSAVLGSAVPSNVLARVTNIPQSVLTKVGVDPSIVSAPQVIKGGKPLVANGKPELLYVGAEFCPYCAAERWAIVGALSKFGTFKGLELMESSSTDVYPNTNTFSFLNATYTSKYLTLVTREIQTRTHAPLQTLTTKENALLNLYDVPPYVPSTQYDGSIPFVDFANKYVIDGASYSPQILAGLNWQTIAATLADPTSPVAKGIDGTVNEVTAGVCTMTNNHPGSVCKTPLIQGLEKKL
jgi:thiol-disulfide isomerase/thioredoxin